MQELREHQLFAKFSKCDFFKAKILYLGHVVTKEVISVDPEKIKAIEDWPVPKYVTDVRLFMGITSYYWRFIEGFLRIANPITSLQKKEKKFGWNQKCKDSFKKLTNIINHRTNSKNC